MTAMHGMLWFTYAGDISADVRCTLFTYYTLLHVALVFPSPRRPRSVYVDVTQHTETPQTQLLSFRPTVTTAFRC